MSHFLTVPMNENGVVTDDRIQSDLVYAMHTPFEFSDVFIYSHGWWTSAQRCMGEYNRFTIEFAKLVRSLTGHLPALPGKETLGIGFHWPSMLSDDQDSMANYLEATSYYTMEKRADAVGENGVYSVLRMLLAARSDDTTPLRIHCLGHSFGCKVVCAALQEIITDGITVPNNMHLNLVLLQAAFDNDDLAPGDIYGDIASKIPEVRVLATRSDEDKALQTWYPIAHMVNLFHAGPPRIALGAQGPSQSVIDLFGGIDSIDVDVGFQATALAGMNHRFLMANLTPLHQHSSEPSDSFSGRHSDIFHDEVYSLISGFLFK